MPKEGTGKGERAEEFWFGHIPGLPGGKSRKLQQAIRNEKLGSEERSALENKAKGEGVSREWAG